MDNRNFILVSVARSGSNLLRDYLNQHESVLCLGEIFKKWFIKGKPWRTLSGGSAELKQLHQTDLVSFWKRILEKYQRDKPIIGAKIFYYHREGEEIWQYFASSHTPIIHLVREQLIDSYISQKLAMASGVWKQPEGKSVNAQYERSLTVDLADFQYYCMRFQRHFDSIKALFHDNPYLQISYSELAKEREKTMSAIYGFLGLPNHEASARLVKQVSRPREELILNWDEVASFIKSNGDLCVVH